VHPLTGATVVVAGVGVTNGTAKTGATGAYAFTSLPADERLVVTVAAAGFVSLSKQVSLTPGNATMLNFTLVAAATAKPYTETQGFNGFLACETAVTANDQTQRTDCGSTENKRIWILNLNPGVQGVVLETAWSPVTPAAQAMHLTATVGSGATPILLSEVEGPSVLRAAISQDNCVKYFAQGGTVTVTWSAATDAVSQEAAVGAAASVQQDFRAVATSFFVDPAPPGYTSS